MVFERFVFGLGNIQLENDEIDHAQSSDNNVGKNKFYVGLEMVFDKSGLGYC